MVLQLKVIREGFVPSPKSMLGWPTGIRCPRCGTREIVYNGNYFCWGFDSDDCAWALPCPDPYSEGAVMTEWGPTEEHHVQLQDALVRSQYKRIEEESANH